jgi:SSS family solute:Na+ symporter
MIRAQNILDIWWQISGIFGGGVLGVFILGLLRVRLRLWQGLVSIGISIAVISWATFVREPFLSKLDIQVPDSWSWIVCNMDVVAIGAAGTAAMMIVALLFGLLNRNKNISA